MNNASCSVLFRIVATSVFVPAVESAQAGVVMPYFSHIHWIRLAWLIWHLGWCTVLARAKAASRAK